jgi:hypothetical protein
VKRLNKILGLAILVALLILTPLYTTTRGEIGTLQIGTQALPITIDGDPSEWGTYDCTGKAPGLHLETVNGIPQWIWCDPEGDERTDFASPDPRADLLQFRVTADENYLYGLVIVKQMPFNIGDNGGTFVAIAINRNGTTTGEIWFAGDSNTKVDSNAKWQYQVVLNLADSRYSGQGRTQVTDGLQANWGGIYYIVDSTWSHQSDPDALVGADVSRSAIEFRVKWSTIGGVPSGGSFFLRISLITARGWSNYGGNSGGTWDIGGSGVSDALDCITDKPGNTWDEVQDQVVNYYIDLYFATTPPYYPIPEPIVIPLLVAGAGGGFAAYLFKARRRK